MLQKELEEFDSKEEWYFTWWLNELKKHNVVLDYTCQPKAFDLSSPIILDNYKQLKTKKKEHKKKLLEGHIYTCDFRIVWNQKSLNFLHKDVNGGIEFGLDKSIYLYSQMENNERVSYIETKGEFDFANMTRLATINIKWVYEKYGIYVNLVKIGKKRNSFFDKTFTPERFLLTDKLKGKRILKYEPKNLQDLVQSFQ